MGMSAFYTGAATDDAASVATLHAAVDHGVTLFDTAEMYGPYTNEELLGRALSARRDDVVIATKGGTLDHLDGGVYRMNGRRENLRLAVEGSLRRLRTDRIDLYYQHRTDPGTPVEETVGAFVELIAEGKILHYGLSEASPSRIRAAHAIHPVTAVQTEYSMWSREPEDQLIALLRELSIGFVPYSPLGRGFLTGALRNLDTLSEDDYRRGNPRFQGENLTKNLRIADAVEQIAGRGESHRRAGRIGLGPREGSGRRRAHPRYQAHRPATGKPGRRRARAHPEATCTARRDPATGRRPLRRHVLRQYLTSQTSAGEEAMSESPKVALVTGASAGIGEAIAHSLAAAGYAVYAAARRVQRMSALEEAGMTALEMDVTDEASMRSGIDRILAETGRLDVLVNNAGYGSYGAVEDVALSEGRRQFDVNVFGPLQLIQLVTPIMRNQRSGKILNVTSVGGKIHTPFAAWYHGSKFALEGMSDVLRIELAPFGIDVIVIEPGAIKSEWSGIAAKHLVANSGSGAYAAAAQNQAKAMTSGPLHDGASDPSVIGATIVRAVQARRPRTRYFAGHYARTVLLLRRLLSDRAFDSVIARSVR